MDQDRNLLFGVFAVQLRKVTPSQIMAAAGAWASDPSKDLPQRLMDEGALSGADRTFLDRLVEEAIEVHGGDVAATLVDVGGRSQVERSFYGSIVVQSDGKIETGGVDPVGHTGEPLTLGVEESPGRYSQVGETARGGMGRILLVHDEYLGRDVALKELLPDIAAMDDDPSEAVSPARAGMSLLSRFLQEARVTGQLEHPSIVPVYELGHRPDGTLYYTMKLVRGATLEDAIAGAGDFGARLALLPHFIDLCQGIAYAHSMKVIHRDIKPSNVMVGKFGETVVLDWGLAKIRDKRDVHQAEIKETLRVMNLGDEDAVANTAYGEIMGTPLYMPPEQAKGQLEQVDERSDVYSLGAVLYQLLTGHPPYEIGPLRGILEKVISEQPTPVRTVCPEAPPELAAICEKALHKNPKKRYVSAKALADEVQRFQSGALVQAYQYSPRELARRFVVRHRALVAATGIALVALSTLGVYSYWKIFNAHQNEHAARVDAELARDNAHAERREAEAAHALARMETQRAEESQYYASIQLAAARLAQNQPELAKAALESTPPSQRHWEWGHYMRLASAGDAAAGALVEDLFAAPANASDRWRGAVQNNTVTLEGHGARIHRVRFSRDGSRIVTASDDETVRVWDAETGALQTTFELESPAFDADFSPDGRFIATGEFERRVVLWDLETGDRRGTFTDFSNPVALVEFSPDGQFLVTATLDMHLRVWHAATGFPVFSKEVDEPILDVAFSPEGWLWVPTAKTIAAYSLASEDVGTVKAERQGRGVSTHLSSDGRLAAARTTDDVLTAWDTTNETDLFEAPASPGQGLASLLPAAFSVDGNVSAYVDTDARISVVDAANGEVLASFPAAASARAYHAAFSPDGSRLAVVHDGNLVRLYEPGTAAGEKPGVLPGHDDIVFHIAFNDDGSRFATASYDGDVVVWDRATHNERFRLTGHTGELLTVVFTPDGSIIGTAGWDDKFRVWSAETGELVFESDLGLEGRPIGGGPRSPMVMVASGMTWMRRYNPDVSLIVAPGPNNASIVFDRASWTPKFVLGGHDNWVWQQEFSPDGTRIVSHAYQSRSPKVWDAGTGTELFALTGHEADVHLVKFSHDSSKLVTASFDGTARIWDAATGHELQRLTGHEGGLASARFSPDDRYVATGSIDQSARLWDVATGETVATFVGHGNWVINADFSPDGERLLTTSLDETVKIWNLNGFELATLQPGARVFHAVWSPDSLSIVTGLGDGTTRIWDATDWK